MNAPATKVTPISGFPELLPAERLLELHFLDVIREVFELHGFAPLETRAVEPVERLLGKGGDADKEIYGISRLAGDDSGKDAALGLHFDLTVPFARYVLENAGRLAFPFRRYQIQKVWRGERPQEGRFREFTQADIDVVDVGELAPHFEAEMPLVIAEAFRRLPVGEFRIQVNNRKVPEGFYLGIGLSDVVGTLRIVDRLDEASAPTRSPRCSSSPAPPRSRRARCWHWPSISSTDLSFVDAVRALGVQHPTLDEGLDALAAVIAVGMEQAPGVLVADLQIARGLDYYTGTVYETQLVGSESWGSVCSGRALRLAGHRRSHDLPRRRHLDRADPARAPARHQARAHREPLHPGGRARRRRRRGDAARRPGGSPRRCGRAASRARWRPAPRSSASRSATPTGAASPSSGSRAPGRAATRSRTSARVSRSTPTPRRGSARRGPAPGGRHAVAGAGVEPTRLRRPGGWPRSRHEDAPAARARSVTPAARGRRRSPLSLSSSRARAWMTSGSPRRQAPAGSSEILGQPRHRLVRHRAQREQVEVRGGVDEALRGARAAHEAQPQHEPDRPDDEDRHERRRERRAAARPARRRVTRSVPAFSISVPTPAAERNGVAPGRRAAAGRRRCPRRSSGCRGSCARHRRGSARARASAIVASCTRCAMRTQSTTHSTMPTSVATCTPRRCGDVAVQLHGRSSGSSGRTAARV